MGSESVGTNYSPKKVKKKKIRKLSFYFLLKGQLISAYANEY